MTRPESIPNTRSWPRIVAVIGPAGSGKSTAARYLAERHGYEVHKFAAPIKAMLRALGLGDDHLEGDLKEVPSPLLLGSTPRRSMQLLGTEWGRKLIHPDLLVRAWEREVGVLLDMGLPVVCDDLRYPNELDAILKLGGVTVRIVRKDNTTQCEEHDSETQYVLAQRVVINDGTLAELESGIDRALDSIT